MKKLVSVVMILAMILCLGQAAMGTASAGQYTYDVTFHSQGGHIGSSTGPADTTKTLSQDAQAIAGECARTTAYKDGYRFIGWYTAASGGTYISTSYRGTPVDVYAHWVKLNKSSINFGIEGGSSAITIQGTAGHDWTLVTPNAEVSKWVHITKVNSEKYLFKVDARIDGGWGNRVATICFRDKFGRDILVYIYQEPNYEAIRNKIKNTFQSGRFFNECTGDNKVQYNMKYAALFKCGGTWCTDSAMMDLLNRRLAAFGVLSATKYFDIRDVITGMAVSSKNSKNFTGFKVVKGTCHTNEWHSIVTKGEFSNGGELCNAPGNGKEGAFTNTHGTLTNGAAPTTIKVMFKKPNTPKNAAEVKKEIINLLKTHPEGVFLYSNAGGDHAMLVVGYNETTGSFLYVDNGAGGGEVEYSKTYFKTGHKVTEDQMYAAVFCIGYCK